MKLTKIWMGILFLQSTLVYSQSYSFQGFWETKKGKSHEVVNLGVKGSEYQKAFAIFEKEGLELTQIDGYDINGSVYFNFIFRTPSGKRWFSKHGMTSQRYQSLYDRYIKNGNYRLGWLDSYRQGNRIRYVAIFTKKGAGSQKAYHGLTQAQHQSRFNDWTSNGWDPVNVSVVTLGGQRYYTAFYEKKDGGFTLKSFLNRDGFEETHASLADNGKHLMYLNAYTHDDNMLPRFAAIWRSGTSSGSYHPNVDGFSIMEKASELGAQGYFTRFVTGYSVGAGHRFDVYFYKPQKNAALSGVGTIKN